MISPLSASSPALAALAAAIEMAIGYPRPLFAAIGHPVTWIGALIGWTDRRLNDEKFSRLRRRLNGFLAIGLVLVVAAVPAALLERLLLRSGLPFWLGLGLAALAASSLIAQKSLGQHVRAVALALEAEGLPGGRRAVGAIVGRDIERLDEAGVRRAAIESLAENFSDGVAAPTLWLAVLGLPGGACYKAINTADSMIGHLTPRHAAFGFAAAKLDDFANLLPARWAALTVILAAATLQGADAAAGLRCVRRDARGHPSPNAGWPEAAFAGALGLRLGGPRSYGAKKVADAWIGEGRAEVGARDMERALALYRRACVVNFCALALAVLALTAPA